MTDLALQAPPIIAYPGAEYADDVRQFQGIPGIERAPEGRLWATWYSGGDWEGPENYLLLSTSADDGASWSEPVLAVHPPGQVRAFDPCLWLDPQNRLWLFWSQSLGGVDGRFGVWAMVTSNPDSAMPDWSEPRRLGDGIMMNKPTVTRAGEWVLPVSIWPAQNRAHQPPEYFHPGERSGAYAVVSTDQGKTFEYRGKADGQAERVFDEHMFVERADGSWWMLNRVKIGIWENVSTDGGRTWDQGHLSSIPHLNSRFFIRRLQSGNLLLVRHDHPEQTLKPNQVPRSHLAAFLSSDDGQSWQGGLLLDERDGVSYPDGTQMPDGTIHVIYDWNRTKDKRILLATFTEEDILAGKWISPVARPRVLINQATAVGKDGPVTTVAELVAN